MRCDIEDIKQKTKAILRDLAKDHAYVVRRGVAKGLKRRGGLGFVPQFSQPSAEDRFLGDLRLQGQTVYDIGAYEGVMALFFARAVGPRGRVIAFEPNPINRARLESNVALNKFDNVTVFQVAIGSRQEKAQLAIRQNNYATGSIDPSIKMQILEERGSLIEVEVDTLDHRFQIARLPPPNFVKIDVEGYELNVLNGMTDTIAKARPDIFIELHGVGVQKKRENARKVVNFLSAAAYSIYHVESAREVGISEPNITEGHIYCVPKASPQSMAIGDG